MEFIPNGNRGDGVAVASFNQTPAGSVRSQ